MTNEPMQQAADHANGQNGSAPGPNAAPPDVQVEQLRAELAQVREEAERQRKNGNLVRVYADIQGERLTLG